MDVSGFLLLNVNVECNITPPVNAVHLDVLFNSQGIRIIQSDTSFLLLKQGIRIIQSDTSFLLLKHTYIQGYMFQLRGAIMTPLP